MVIQIPLPTDKDVGPLITAHLNTYQAALTLPPGEFVLATPIVVQQGFSKQTLRGSGRETTILRMPARSSMIGIDARYSDELSIENLSIKEASGAHTCAGVALGGTSLRLNNIWCGNMKYGIVGTMGGGTRLLDIDVEACDWGLYFQSGFEDPTIGLTATTNIRRCSGSLISVYKCTTGIEIRKGKKARTKQIRLRGVSFAACGTDSIDDTPAKDNNLIEV
jgi:hypothetical protein